MARHFVRGMIIDDQTLTIGQNISKDHESHVDLDNAPNHINFDPAQAFAMGETLKSNGIDPLTYGSGMQFLHESVHTKLGHKVLGRKDDFPYFVDTKGIATGRTVDVINSFRRQLRIPTRVWYPWVPTSSGYVVPWQVKGSSKAGQIRIYESTYLHYKSKYKN